MIQMAKSFGQDYMEGKEDTGLALAIDSNDYIYVTGFTFSDFEGNTLIGDHGTRYSPLK